MPHPDYTKSVAYFSMEIAIDQTMKTYSGGLGFLAGSHMRSAYELNQNLVGVTMLWKLGYYDQVRGEDQKMNAQWIQKYYSFLEDTGVTVDVNIHNTCVKVRAFYLRPEIFGTAPIYFLTTDIEENDHLSRTISYRLYDSTTSTRIAQEIVLGIGGAKVLKELKPIDVYHLNEAHALPLAFHLYQEYQNLDTLKAHLVFTTHTPEMAGNSVYDMATLTKMHYFAGLDQGRVQSITEQYGDQLSCTAAALKLCKKANAVSHLHAQVARDMWKHVVSPEHIVSITNSQNAKYWQDQELLEAFDSNDETGLVERKKELKKELFKEVAQQEGDLFDENILTIVWARRFAGYKRPELITRDLYAFLELIDNTDFPIQIIWAGKPYPKDHPGVDLFNHLINITYTRKNCAVLVGYELDLSAKLKKGADIWLNTPRITREASGTSGMSAAMNAAINFSINDGWVPEFAKDEGNCFLIPSRMDFASIEQQDQEDYENMMKVLKDRIIPMYYESPEKWRSMMKNSMSDVCPQFESARMATEYYSKLYNASS